MVSSGSRRNSAAVSDDAPGARELRAVRSRARSAWAGRWPGVVAAALAIAGGWVRSCESSRTGLCGRRPGCGSRFRPVTADCTLVGAVQPAVLSAVLAVAVVLKLVVMPDDARLLDRRVLVIIHMHTSHTTDTARGSAVTGLLVPVCRASGWRGPLCRGRVMGPGWMPVPAAAPRRP